MTTLTGSKVLTVPTHSLRLSAIWLPVLILAIGSHWPAHIFMWALALSIYAAAKWITLVDCPGSGSVPVARRWGYLFFWPGMNASRFFARGQAVSAPARKEWFAAAAKTAAGILLLFTIAPRVVAELPGLGAATAMIGLVFMLHFGLFHLLSVAWRQAGVDAPPIMDAPFAATSLSDFWGRRWNRAFRDLAHTYVFRPLAGRWGTTGAMFVAFFASGIIHDLVISVPARGGYGLPTIYFLLHGVGLWIEKSAVGKRVGLGRGVGGRLYCLAVTVAPLGLLFHRPFIERILLPLLAALVAELRVP